MATKHLETLISNIPLFYASFTLAMLLAGQQTYGMKFIPAIGSPQHLTYEYISKDRSRLEVCTFSSRISGIRKDVVF